MYNEKKVQMVKKIFLIIFCLVFFIGSFSAGFGIGSAKTKKNSEPIKKEVVKKKIELTPKLVDQFLLAFYTKKDLGENRNRYKPLMTETMYNQATAEEEEPVNQAYKGYVVNQVLETADIYLNEKDLSAICVVTYKNTQRTKLGTDQGALVNQSNKESVKLTYVKEGDKFFVNKVEPVLVSDDQAVLKTRNAYKSESQEMMNETELSSFSISTETMETTDSSSNQETETTQSTTQSMEETIDGTTEK
ncbi:hypothetical protein [Enterococcus faecalis]|uniref:hypothetical protein n=1 Tax=Enterococcus faecalis TaxID=1351 RepID=UPI001A97C5CC|nr:hypothetical protein [Enterococcus faecalis]MBO1138036.1 hypothetical protein [Enterococcus faecalis]